MAIVDVININNEKVSELDLPDSIFNIPVKPEVLHEVVCMQMAKRRRGTASTKRRSEIKGSTRKLFRQKGTGQARRGDIKSPLLRGGGVVFGPKPRDFSYTVPKKKRKLALKMAMSSKLRDNELVVLNEFPLSGIKTKEAASILKKLQLEKPLILIPQKDETVELSVRNIPGAKVLRVDGLNVYDILNHKTLVLLEASVSRIEGRLS